MIRADIAALVARSVPARLARGRTDLRSGTHADVQLVAGCGPYELDVLIRVLDAKRVEIVGQVTRAERVHEPVGGLDLVLYDAEAMARVASVGTDTFGEFQLSGLASGRLVLALGVARDAPCVLIWEGARDAANCHTVV